MTVLHNLDETWELKCNCNYNKKVTGEEEAEEGTAVTPEVGTS